MCSTNLFKRSTQQQQRNKPSTRSFGRSKNLSSSFDEFVQEVNTTAQKNKPSTRSFGRKNNPSRSATSKQATSLSAIRSISVVQTNNNNRQSKKQQRLSVVRKKFSHSFDQFVQEVRSTTNKQTKSSFGPSKNSSHSTSKQATSLSVV